MFRFEKYIFENKSFKPKFILVIKACDKNGDCSFYLTTSKVKAVLNNPILIEKYYIIPSGTVNCFDKETAINISEIHHREYVLMEQKYVVHTENDKLEYIQMIPEEIMKDIYKMALESKYLSPYEKLRAFPYPLFP